MKGKKKTMKKIISAFTAIIMTMTLLSSCSNVKQGGDVGTQNDSKNTTTKFEYADKKLKDDIVAKVGEEEITKDEVRACLALVSSSLFQQMNLATATKEEKDKQLDEKYDDKYTFREMLYKQCIDSLISMNLFAALGKEKGIDYSAEKLKSAYDENNMTAEIEEFKKTYNISDEGFDAYMKKQFIYSDYIQQYVQNDSRMNPGEDVLKGYFNDNYLKAKHILKLTVDQQSNQPLSEEEKNTAKANIEKILKDVKGGSDFDKAVETESEDPGSQSQPEGYVFTDGEMVTEFYEGTKALKVGEISDIIETSYGYHIIKRLALTDDDYTQNAEKVKSAYQNSKFSDIVKEEKDKMKIQLDYDKLFGINDVLYMSVNAQEESEQK